MPRYCLPAFLCALVLLPAVPCIAQQSDFRVESWVYVGDDDDVRPVSHNVTVFLADTIYDFSLAEGGETAILDLGARKLRLIDSAHGITTSFDGQQLEEFVLELNRRAAGTSSPLVRFLAEPRFGETLNEQEHRLTLASQLATYRVQGEKPADATTVRRYAQFADWYAQVNATRPGAYPPAARLSLNAALLEHGLIPREVRYDRQHDDGTSVTLHSKHDYQWQVTDTDRTRIDLALQQAVSATELTPDKYREAQLQQR